MKIEITTVTSKTTVVAANRSMVALIMAGVVNVAEDRKSVTASAAKKTKGTQAKIDGAANLAAARRLQAEDMVAACLLQAEIANMDAAAKTMAAAVGKVIAITQAIVIAAMARTGRITIPARVAVRARIGVRAKIRVLDRVLAAATVLDRVMVASAALVKVRAVIRDVMTTRQTLLREGCTGIKADAALTMIEVVMVADKNGAMTTSATGMVQVKSATGTVQAKNAAGGIGLLTQ